MSLVVKTSSNALQLGKNSLKGRMSLIISSALTGQTTMAVSICVHSWC